MKYEKQREDKLPLDKHIQQKTDRHIKDNTTCTPIKLRDDTFHFVFLR